MCEVQNEGRGVYHLTAMTNLSPGWHKFPRVLHHNNYQHGFQELRNRLIYLSVRVIHRGEEVPADYLRLFQALISGLMWRFLPENWDLGNHRNRTITI